MVAKVKSKSSFQIHSLIMLVLMCSGWFLPEGNILTEYGVRISMIFLGCIWGWIFVGLVEPSLLALVFLVLAGQVQRRKLLVPASVAKSLSWLYSSACLPNGWKTSA